MTGCFNWRYKSSSFQSLQMYHDMQMAHRASHRSHLFGMFEAHVPCLIEPRWLICTALQGYGRLRTHNTAKSWNRKEEASEQINGLSPTSV